MALVSAHALADENTIQPFHDIPASLQPSLAKQSISTKRHRLVELDLAYLKAHLAELDTPKGIQKAASVYVDLPDLDGHVVRYQVFKNTTMNPKLAAKFPEIKTYDARTENGAAVAKLDVTPAGFHAMIVAPGKQTVFIDPYNKKSDQVYKIYRSDQITRHQSFSCDVHSPKTANDKMSLSPIGMKKQGFIPFGTCTLKKYRLALAATFEYTRFTGGTLQTALAAQVTTINRVNGIFERDIAVTLELIANNDAVICTYQNCPSAPTAPAGTVPYVSGNTDQMYDANQINVERIIGTAGYDIGHVFDQNTKNSGLAGLGVVCKNTEKAFGVTGSVRPVGDPFDVDYVAHELGHQFGANHTHNNNCNREPLTSVEPGSGSTIMGYAGICAPNVQSNSDAYFHGINLEEIGNYLSSASCSVDIPIPNHPTNIMANIGSKANPTVLPSGTPLMFTASAIPGSVNANLTYTWEQMNPEVSTQPPVSTSLNGPNFRSFSPQSLPTRYLPNLASLANNGPFMWEVLSTVGRRMDFRVSVRSNTLPASCNAYADFGIQIDPLSGPFLVTYPSQKTDTWVPNTNGLVQWDVANTNLGGAVNAENVDIFLSTDGGLTYPTLLAQNVSNNGQTTVNVPNIETNMARVMVTSSSRTFFNISKNNFMITAKAFKLTEALRNPMDRSSAFIYFNALPGFWNNATFSVNGLPAGASVSLDLEKNRFVIQNITTPQSANISISILSGGGTITTDTIQLQSAMG